MEYFCTAYFVFSRSLDGFYIYIPKHRFYHEFAETGKSAIPERLLDWGSA